MSVVNGKDVMLYVRKGADFVPYLCATDCAINIKPELIPTSTIGSGRGTNRKVRRIEWSVSFSGVSAMVGEVESYFVFDAADPLNIVKETEIRMAFTDTADNERTFSGAVLTESLELSGGADDFSPFTHEMIGQGMYELHTTIAVTPILTGLTQSLILTYTSGTPTVVSNPTLIGKEIVAVFRAGRWYHVITTGTPSASEVKFDSAAGSLTFQDAFNVDEETFVLYK